jgi:non-heme Fe2+,alpha-ketoglutarate-dependent halogenase
MLSCQGCVASLTEGGDIVTTRLSKEQLKRYDSEGIVFPVRVFSLDEVAHFRIALESIADDGGGRLKRFDSLHLFFDWAHRIATHESLLSVVGDILGDDILIDGTLVLYKPPHDSSYVSWHQDSVYSGWHLSPSTSAWIALTGSHRANGCMRVIPGSHKQGLLSHNNVQDDSNLLRRGERVEAIDESCAVDVALQQGDISLHQSTIVHGSSPNVSAEPRIGFIVRFVTNRITNRERPMLRVRGQADCSHLTLAQPPVQMDRQHALAAWRSFSTAKRDQRQGGN